MDIIPDTYKAQAEENAARLLRSQAAATQHDAGLMSYVVLQQNGASNHFTIIEMWRDTRSYEMHQGADHTVEFRRQIQPFLGGPFDSREHHSFDSLEPVTAVATCGAHRMPIRENAPWAVTPDRSQPGTDFADEDLGLFKN